MLENSRQPELILRRPEADRLMPRITVLESPATAAGYSMYYFARACEFADEYIQPTATPEEKEVTFLQMKMAAVLHHHLEGHLPAQSDPLPTSFDRQDYEKTRNIASKTIKLNDACEFFLQLSAHYLEDHMRGKEPRISPFTSQGMQDVINLMGMLKMTTEHATGLQESQRKALGDELAATARWATHFFLRNNEIGSAGAMINFIQDTHLQEEYVEELSRALKEEVRTAPLSEAGKIIRFRTLRQQLIETLVDPRVRTRFDTFTPNLDKDRPDQVASIERAAEATGQRVRHEDVIANMGNGYTVRLEAEYYEERQFNPDGTERWTPQTTIHYDKLDKKALSALQTAIKAIKKRQPPEHRIQHSELGLRFPSIDGRPELCVQNRTLPGEMVFGKPVYLTDESFHQTYIVVECNSQDDLSDLTPLPGEIKLNAPKKANAFWISGNARYIIGDPEDAELTRKEEIDGKLIPQPRWAIIPIDYFNIVLDRPEAVVAKARGRFIAWLSRKDENLKAETSDSAQ